MERGLGIITCNYSAKNPSVLTETRPLASLPYVGRYRLVDFPLSNMVNSGIKTVGLIMPYNYRSLIDHVGSGRDWDLERKGGGLFVLPGSAFGTSRTGSRFLLRDFAHNRAILERDKGEFVVVSSSNFVYNMDLDELLATHRETGADITVLTKKSEEDNQDVMSFEVEGDRVMKLHHGVRYGETAFLDCFIIRREFFLEILDWYKTVDYLDVFEALENDYNRVDVRIHDYQGYAAPVFDVKSFYEHNMELLDPEVTHALFPADRFIKTKAHDTAPCKYEKGANVRNSLVSAGSRISGTITDSILGRNVIVESGATVRNSIVLQGCIIRSGATVENAIVDRNNLIPAGTELRGTPEEVLVKGKGAR